MSRRAISVGCPYSVVTPVLLVGVLILLGGRLEAQAGERQLARATAIRSIQIGAKGPRVVVGIEGTGTLPLPTSGVAGAPPRIYFDFPGVALKAPAMVPSGDPRILRVRAGVHSVTPLVTRVVIDLVALQPYRVERGEGGRIDVVLEGPTSAAPAIAPVPPLAEPPTAVPAREPAVAVPMVPREPEPVRVPAPSPPPPATPVTTSMPAPVPEIPPDKVTPPAPTPAPPRAAPSSPPGSPLPAKDLERYRRQIAGALDRLRLQEPLLAALDGAGELTVDRVQLAVEEFERLRADLIGIKPPDTLRSQHDMLFQATTLALMATRLRVEAFRTADAATLRNAASAAAGATLLLDRACADLGCPDSGR